MTKIFFDTEFTGLHQNTTLISIGLVSECGKHFYAEFADFDYAFVDDWILNNVISKLKYLDKINAALGSWEHWISDKKHYSDALDMAINKDKADMSKFECVGKTPMIKNRLEKWLAQFDKVELWSDCLSYDWMLFCQLWGGAMHIPKNIFYIPFDICTSFVDMGIDPDINREEFVGYSEKDSPEATQYKHLGKHNSLWDAVIVKACYDKLYSNKI